MGVWWGGVGEEDRDQHKEREIEGVRGRRGPPGRGSSVWLGVSTGVQRGVHRRKQAPTWTDSATTDHRLPCNLHGKTQLVRVQICSKDHCSLGAVYTLPSWDPGSTPQPMSGLYRLTGWAWGGGARKVATAPCKPSGRPVGLKQTAPFIASHQQDPCTPG